MTESSAPPVDCEQYHAVLRVPDVQAAADYYTNQLGFEFGFLWGDPPSMAAVNLGDIQIFLEKGTPAPQGCSVYFVVGSADDLHEFHRAHTVDVVAPPTDRPYGLRDYGIRDLNGYELRFGHHLFNEGPPLEIERTELTVRIEKRLAALVVDLAEYKRMSLSSCLEETLLHALAGLGPHTKTQLRHIEKLRQKHGIDYDSHGSYRFVER